MSSHGGNPAILAAALALSFGLFGCSLIDDTPVRTNQPARPARSRGPSTITGTHRYQIAGNKGFVEDLTAGDLAWSLVYDDHWNLIGTYTDHGKTYRHRGRERPIFLGDFDPDSSLRALHGIQSLEVPVKRFPIGPLLTLEDVEEEKRKSGASSGDSSE